MEFSVIIPTFNRASILRKTLQGLASNAATLQNPQWEVCVVDDGSTDDTPSTVEYLAAGFPVSLRYLKQANRKQGAARNLGARSAAGNYLVFLGDDTIPASNFLVEHQRSHQNKDPGVVVIGYTPWAADFRTTRFMNYVGEQGWQFGFALIQNPEELPFNFFYTSNLSISRDFFLSAGGFDEDFTEYGWEDIELSLRLQKAGMRLIYNSRAVAYHYHPTSIRSFVKRQKKVGASAWRFYEKHPEMAGFLNVLRARPYPYRSKFQMWLLTLACEITETWRWLDMSRYYPDLMSYYYNRGVLQARNHLASF
ncbi:MAG: glycosyltransferase [Acidobacteria bacterium]|nr:glycosyltransferase [Acidobacteriota bacterium]